MGQLDLDLLKYRIAKAGELLPAFITHPSRFAPVLRGVSPTRLVSIDLGWVKTANINTVIDIGAHMGQFSNAVHHVLPEASIYAFEPLSDCYEILVKGMAGVPGFHAYNVAVGDEDGTIDFHRNDFSQSSSALPMEQLHSEAFTWSAHSSKVQVAARRLDGVLANETLNPKVLIKIDVQGFEDRVLLGGQDTLRRADFVVVETSLAPLYEDQASFESVYEIMIGLGFKYAGNLDQLPNPADDRILQADALFVRRP